MDRRRLKFLLLGLGVAGTMLFLLVLGVNRPGGFVYYLTVKEFVDGGGRQGGGYRVNGKVEPGTIDRHPSGQEVRFVMTDGAAKLRVAYHGIIPDTFVDEADVVVEGAMGPDGTFDATTLLAKCPSKYEAAASAKSRG